MGHESHGELRIEGMMTHRKIGLACLIAAVAGLGLGAGALRSQDRSTGGATSATAPTTTQDPVAIDLIWQKASAKYDAARQALLADVNRADGEGPFRPDWESLQKYEVPEWYADAKFGIFIHWGVYSVPAFGSEWYPREMYHEGSEIYKHHVATYGSQDKLATRISFRSLKRSSLMRRSGRR
jgi:alpha-L-fucosidase